MATYFFKNNEDDCDVKRDCSGLPFSEKCAKFCIAQMLKITTAEEKKLILGLAPATVGRIEVVYEMHTINDFNDLKEYLTKEQADEISDRFQTITQLQLDYLHINKYDRQEVINAIRKLNLGLDSKDNLGAFEEIFV